MMNSANNLHTLHAVDSDLDHLRSLLRDMLQKVAHQIETVMQAVEQSDSSLALRVIELDGDILSYEHNIDTEALSALARYSPVADDLRAVISSLKIANELQYIDYEIADFARQVVRVFDPETSNPNKKISADIVKLGDLVKYMLSQIIRGLRNQDTRPLYGLLELELECEEKLQEGIKHQLDFVLHDARKIRLSLEIMLMMKALEHCGEHCKNLAEYLIYMLDGVDVRHLHQHDVA